MRTASRKLLLFVLGLLSAVFLGAAMAVTAAVSLAATALIVPGTGTPKADGAYIQNVQDYYLDGTACETGASCTLKGIEYPASFWPMPFPGWCRSGPNGCDTWNVSVAEGVTGLNTDVDAWLEEHGDDPTEKLVIFGYSQGGQVVSDEMRVLQDKLTDEQKKRVEIVMIGSIANPDGGLWPRLSPLSLVTQLLLDATLGPPMVTDSGIKTTVIGFEYDPVVYSPKYWGNPLAVLNALVAFDTVHGQYLAGPNRPDSGSLPYGYTVAELEAALADPKNVRVAPGTGNEYIMIPAKSLPLADFILGMADSAGVKPLVKPFVDLLAPIAKVIVDLGYDWSGNPDVPQSLSLLPFNPFQNWLAVGAKLIAAAIEGVQAFLGNFGDAARTTPVTTPQPLSTLETPGILASEVLEAAVQRSAPTAGESDASAGAPAADGVRVEDPEAAVVGATVGEAVTVTGTPVEAAVTETKTVDVVAQEAVTQPVDTPVVVAEPQGPTEVTDPLAAEPEAAGTAAVTPVVAEKPEVEATPKTVEVTKPAAKRFTDRKSLFTRTEKRREKGADELSGKSSEKASGKATEKASDQPGDRRKLRLTRPERAGKRQAAKQDSAAKDNKAAKPAA